jgi:DNA repair exonuclease SbcCD ATPase subunit
MIRTRSLVAALAGLLAAALFLPTVKGTAYAGDESRERYLYQWTDERGNAHITDSLEKVPPKYRSRAKALEQGVPGSGPEERPAIERPRQGITDGDAAAPDEEALKNEWQQRMHDARQRKADAEERLRQYEEQRKSLQEKSGYGLYGYTPQVQAELDRLDQEIGRAQVDLKNARDQIENVIPEEARKAGIPPGWLREMP